MLQIYGVDMTVTAFIDTHQPDEPLASLVTTNSIINVYGFIVVEMLLMYSVLHCLYYVWKAAAVVAA